MNTDSELIKRLNFENIIWLIFIIVSIVDIDGDELIKKSVRLGDDESKKKATNLFLIVALISILVYIYFFYRNYTDYKKYKNDNYLIRLIGSILILAGTFCLLYFQISSSQNDNLPSNV